MNLCEMKNNTRKTIKLMGERRIKTFAIGMVLMIAGLSIFISLLIHFAEADNLALYLLLYGLYGLTMAGNIYLLINTERKLVKAQLLQGLSMIVLALTAFVIFMFLLLGNQFSIISLYSACFLLVLTLARWILVKINYHNFKNSVKYGASFLICMIGVAIGCIIYEYIKNLYGITGTLILAIFCSFSLSVLFGILGVFGINRYLLASKKDFKVEFIE